MFSFLALRRFAQTPANVRSEVSYYAFIAILCYIAFLVAPTPEIAMWFGFMVAGYSAIANDSIQTLGTFLSSNQRMPWWAKWLFVGGILIITHVYGWIVDRGDIAFGRLASIPQPATFAFLTLLGPVILLVLTRWKMPVSTTFLILSVFSSKAVIKSMLIKTFGGYMVAFGSALALWMAISYFYHHREFGSKTYDMKKWRIFQALSTAFLWSVWLMQDTANISVFLPRVLSFHQMAFAVGYLFLILGFLMYIRGGRIQAVVTEKTDITDYRAATVIDLAYALVLFVFKEWNHIPMSTTWVFLGLLAGREIALTLFTMTPKPYSKTAQLVFKDITRAGIGLLISLLLVLFVT